jgi:hypothetical protein
MAPKPAEKSEQRLASLKVEKPEQLSSDFIKEMDPLLLKPEDFLQRWAEIFRELPPSGEVYERLVRQKMPELKDYVVPQLLGSWLFALGHTCKLMRKKEAHRWQDVVGHYHALIARILLSKAYSTFTMRSQEDRIFLEGLALWAGHDYSDPLGSDVCWFVNTYRKTVMRKHELNWTYQAWSVLVQRALDGNRVLRELAEISVISINCRGLKSPPFAPQNLIDKILPYGKEDLLHYVQAANPPKIRAFTRFVAEDIATRKTPWPTQKDVDARLAPLQILDSGEKHKTEIKEGASPINSPRGPGESPVTSPRKKTTALETQVVTPSKAQVKSHMAKTVIDDPNAKGLS